MSISHYIWTVARTLRSDVRPHLNNSTAIETIEQSIRVLTTVANALETQTPCDIKAPDSINADFLPANLSTLESPAENPAAYSDTANVIKKISKSIDSTTTKNLDQKTLREARIWEKNLIDFAIARVDEVENTPLAITGTNTDQHIDRTRLEQYLRSLPGEESLKMSEFTPILGGRSRQTAIFSTENSTRFPEKPVVQRSMPGVGEGGGAFNTPGSEFTLLNKLKSAGMLVPQPILLELDSTKLGAPFMILQKMDGQVAHKDYWSIPASSDIALQLANQMALLHKQPIEDMVGVLVGSDANKPIDRVAEIETFAEWWFDNARWSSITMSSAIAWLREGIDVARCTVERLMRHLRLQGVRRGKVVRTTVVDKAVACPLAIPGQSS